MSKPTTKQICESFQDCIERGDNIDIYQMCAVAWRIASDRWVARFYYFKACICFVFQTTMLSLMVYQFSRENIRLTLNGEHPNQQDRSEIGERYHLITKCIAFVASVWISVNVWSWLRNLEQQSLYRIDIRDFRNCPVYVNHTFVAVGLLVNFFTLFIALIGNNIVIYFAENALEVILNCVAIFWLFEIDNQLIGPNDFQTLRYWLTDLNNTKESEIATKLDSRCMYNCGCSLSCCVCCCSSCSGDGCNEARDRRNSAEVQLQTSNLGDATNKHEEKEEEEEKKSHSAQPSNTQSETDDVSNTASIQTGSYPANEDTNEQKHSEEDDASSATNCKVDEMTITISNAHSTESGGSKPSDIPWKCSDHRICKMEEAKNKVTCVTRTLCAAVAVLEILTLCGTVVAPVIILVYSFVV